MLPGIHKGIGELDEAVTKGLKPKQVKAFYEGLDILTNNLSNIPANTIIVKVTKTKTLRK
jgi:hypothetical protein